MTAADAFTRASPTFVAANRTNERQGEAIEVSPAFTITPRMWIRTFAVAAIIWLAGWVALFALLRVLDAVKFGGAG